jgi:hypothetical protein
MAVRIRVYPQTGMMGMNGMMGGAVSAQTHFSHRLQAQKQVSNLQLGYERALADERINRVRLEERMRNPYLSPAGIGAFGGMPLGMGLPMGGLPIGGMPMGLPMGGLPMGGMPMGGMPMGGIPAGFAGHGQSNVTNQVSSGAAAQTVTNSNVSNVAHTLHPVSHGGWGMPRFGGGGLISGLLGALI